MFARFGICSDGNLPVIVGWATLTIWRCKIFRSPSSLPDLWLHRLDERAVQPNYECTIRENELAGPSSTLSAEPWVSTQATFNVTLRNACPPCKKRLKGTR